ncbi:MAG: glycyl-tRNA synthetase, beta subunit [Pseudomonadota bacterium]
MKTHDAVIFELGTEELPPKSLPRLRDAFEQSLVALLGKAGVSYEALETFAAPRRLAILLRGVSSHQPDQILEKRGPALSAAWQADGTPTQATLGFARGLNVDPQALDTLKTDKGEWLYYRQQVKGTATVVLLPELIRQALAALPIARRMRWGSGSAEFVRPVKWVLFMADEQVIDCEIMGIRSGRETRGHRFHHPDAIPLAHAGDYADILATQGRVISSFEQRQTQIMTQVRQLASELGGSVADNDDLLAEITALVEWPVALAGSFDARYLALPAEALITTMQENQKYFPVLAPEGGLLPCFITVSNLESTHPASIQRGNERVIRPRLADAEFFWNQDRKQPLDHKVQQLAHVTFQKDLGSVLDKTTRVVQLSSWIAHQMQVNVADAARAAYLAKADLLTEMVGEFTNLQGVMGRYYALADGEAENVAWAIEEQYYPRQSGGALPASDTGRVLALAEKLDTLCGIFSAGLIPTGDKDPYALRRAALGIIRILMDAGSALSPVQLVHTALDGFSHNFERDTTEKAVLDFLYDRLRGYCLEAGFQHDEFEAVMAVSPASLTDFLQRLEAVRSFRHGHEAESLAAANKRIQNLLKKSSESGYAASSDYAEDLFEVDAERALATAASAAAVAIAPMMESRDYQQALRRLGELRPVVDAFFADVMVMAEDQAVRNNRLALLSSLAGLFMNIADIASLQKAER